MLMWFCAHSTIFCSKKVVFTNICQKKCRIYALLSKNKFWTWSQMGPKYQFGPKKVQILLTSPKFFRFPHFFSTFPGFLGFSQFFSVVFRFSKVLHKSLRLHRGTNKIWNSGLGHKWDQSLNLVPKKSQGTQVRFLVGIRKGSRTAPTMCSTLLGSVFQAGQALICPRIWLTKKIMTTS